MDQSKIQYLADIGLESLVQSRDLLSQLLTSTNANASYQLTYQILKLGGLAAEIPRLVVFGQQSMGKTTLLDFIMGGPIGFSSTDTGTKQPVVIMLTPNESGFNKIECKLQGKLVDIQDLQSQMKAIMGKTEIISENEIELQMIIPNCVHAMFVDLPGIKDDSKEGAQLTRNVVRNYVQNNPNDVYILVKKASDDPANWPWSLRDFILTGPPRGLGLNSRQTVVVGTRAKEFLLNEKTDIYTQSQLLERVQRRSVKDFKGYSLPLYLLELYSFNVQEKEASTFQQRREGMFAQINANHSQCKQIITTQFERQNPAVQTALLKYFDVNAFKFELNLKLQTLLNEQLEILQNRLRQRADAIEKEIRVLEVQLYEQNPHSIREQIYLFIRELSGIITELVTGNYMIIRFPDNGEKFLQEFGGNLENNLKEGHELALELFPNRDLYPPNFLETINNQAELVLKKIDDFRESKKIINVEPNHDLETVCTVPQPELNGILQAGQIVRFKISKDKSRVLGFIQSMGDKDDSESASVAFFYIPVDEDGLEEHTQVRPVKLSRLEVIYPLSTILSYSPKDLPPFKFRCWMKKTRSDSWVGVVPVSIRRVIINSDPSEGPIKGTVSYVPIIVTDSLQNLLSGDQADEYNTGICSIDDIFIDAVSFDLDSPRKYKLTQLQRIAGDFADTPLLNQLSLTYLGRWLKFHILSLEPNKKFSDNVMLQLMRSVKNVIDKADWEPLVADLLQTNVRGNLLQLTKLASCATASALRRILRAAIHEVRRLILNGDLSPKLRILANNEYFISKVDEALHEFCKKRAIICSETMQDLIFEQTHAIHFEMIQDFFEGCQQFEREFLDGHNMEEVTKRVKEGLENRKYKLQVTDIYSKDTSGVSHDMIYEEVRIQFWVIKMLLSAPLTTKLYMYFVKDIKDKSKHAALGSKSQDVNLELELQKALLHMNSDSSVSNINSDNTITDFFGLLKNREELSIKIEGLKRANEYVKLALDSVLKLKSDIKSKSQVDFLTRLSANSLELFEDSIED